MKVESVNVGLDDPVTPSQFNEYPSGYSLYICRLKNNIYFVWLNGVYHSICFSTRVRHSSRATPPEGALGSLTRDILRTLSSWKGVYQPRRYFRKNFLQINKRVLSAVCRTSHFEQRIVVRTTLPNPLSCVSNSVLNLPTWIRTFIRLPNRNVRSTK